MPRPESPEGKWVTVPVRVRESLLGKIDGVRGERNRSEWFRSLAESATGPGVLVSRSEPVSGVPEPAAAKPRKRPAKPAATAPRTVTPAPEGVPAAAFREPAPVRPRRPPEGVPLDPTGQPCTHPKGRRSKGLCGACGTYVGAA